MTVRGWSRHPLAGKPRTAFVDSVPAGRNTAVLKLGDAGGTFQQLRIEMSVAEAEDLVKRLQHAIARSKIYRGEVQS